MNIGIGGHHSARSRTNEWLTPPSVLQALGPFDLDPCAPVTRPWPTAREHYTEIDNGLPSHVVSLVNLGHLRAARAWKEASNA